MVWSVSELKFLLNDILYDNGLISGELYVKCGKQHISSLPHDLRTNDESKLLQRKYEIINRWKDLGENINDKYPPEFFDISIDGDYDYDEGRYTINADKVVEYYDSINETNEVVVSNNREQYLNRITDIDGEIKDIDKRQNELNNELKELQSESDKESRNFNKLQKEFLDADDEYESLLKSPELLDGRKQDIDKVNKLWDSIQRFTNYYDTYEMSASEEGIDMDMPLSSRDYDRMGVIESRINNNMKLLNDFYKNGIMPTDKEKEILRDISRDINEYSSYMIEPYNFDIDEIAYLRREAEHDVPDLLSGLSKTPEKLSGLKNKRDSARNNLNNSQSSILKLESDIKDINDTKKRLRRNKKELKERKSNLKDNTPKKSDVKKYSNIEDIRKLAKEFRSDIKKIQDYQIELRKVNNSLGFDDVENEFDGLPNNGFDELW